MNKNKSKYIHPDMNQTMKAVNPSKYVIVRKDAKYAYIISSTTKKALNDIKDIMTTLAAAEEDENVKVLTRTVHLSHLSTDVDIEDIILYGNANNTDNNKIRSRIKNTFYFDSGITIPAYINLEDCSVSRGICMREDPMDILKYYRCLIGNPTNLIIFKINIKHLNLFADENKTN